jgi:hypothetical protein
MTRRSSFAAIVFALLGVLAGCRSHATGKVNVDGDAKPRFNFTGLTVSSLVVYSVPPYLKKGIPLDALTKDNPDTQWIVEGLHTANVPITYGSVPADMKQIVAPKPLSDNTIYFVSTYIGTEDTGAFVGQYFRTRNGQTSEFHDDVSLSVPRRTTRWTGAAVACFASSLVRRSLNEVAPPGQLRRSALARRMK